MKVVFTSIDEQFNRIHFESEVIKEDEVYIFKDLSCEDTMIHLQIKSGQIQLKRIGQVQMDMLFDESAITTGYYVHSMGLEFQFLIQCKQLLIQKNRIVIQYDMILDEGTKTKHKISLNFH